MSAFVELFGENLLSGSEAVKTADALNGKVVAIYFSAHWCPPCRQFTPKLAEWYKKSLKEKGLEVVFVSRDNDDATFKDYYATMPWTALPFSEKNARETLQKKFNISGIPTLVILDTDGQSITTDGRGAVTKDPTGKDFPWKSGSKADDKKGKDGGKETHGFKKFLGDIKGMFHKK
jgi:thiol-disulfide isomerase/thioredoxin|eukprot:CAMPEP_0174312502 /NCGR_PEP_ID=MMETSP0810-20121108/4326_1 /TAXON_ID=73025 ORGANISM="Eutreptiella gymnastica-like, Strain CCMP1594" /NCGR_SAMPLE_ID=MMETSP0810 /ASSEMBLY_ACC=CAM_ASM_000659 /LENGTH=175 /DNA_ID=CAMNT_0015420903 /DNA_START=19 /DNA_END=546 /DNA_ORIENTATION=+